MLISETYDKMRLFHLENAGFFLTIRDKNSNTYIYVTNVGYVTFSFDIKKHFFMNRCIEHMAPSKSS